MPDYIQVFTTTDKHENAIAMTQALVQARLAACAQVVGPVNSTYWWQGKMERADEWLCIFKSRRDLYSELESTVKKLHSYTVPEILAIPVIAGSADYLSWLDKELRPPEA